MRKLVMAAVLAATISISIITTAEAGRYQNHDPHAVTLWWVIFNNPDECTFNPGGEAKCGSVDVFGADYLASVANGAPDPSLIAPNTDAGLAVLYATGGRTNRAGKVQLVASIARSPEGPLDFGGPNSVDPMGLGRALDNPDAEIHLVVRDHGAIVRRSVVTQITNFLEPYCSDPNLLFFAGENICADTQFAIFAEGESGQQDVFEFATGEAVYRARAELFRNGDMVQAVLTTQLDTSRD